ncbi:MAG: hypothetical protein LQ352_005000 [Teloschistes flavicans]|nr:MAG: hypothetical protein LQ352_005000 [Teloschistes flavicans]
MGFPLDLSSLGSPSISSSDTSGNLVLPIRPEDHKKDIDFELWQDPRNAPRGVELVTSIAYSIYSYWKDTANLPIRGKIDGRRLPYSDFEYIVEPLNLQSGVAKLTPLKLGIVSCYILHNILPLPIWPGTLRAEIWDSTEQSQRALAVGKMTIKNSPLRASTNSDPSTNLTVSIPPSQERPWLACWMTFFNFVMAKPNSGTVTIRGGWTYPCRYGYQFSLNVYPSATGTGPDRLIYDHLAITMLTWVDRVSKSESAFLWSQGVKVRGVEVARVSIIQPRSGS